MRVITSATLLSVFGALACAPAPESADEVIASELVGDERVIARDLTELVHSGRTLVRSKILDPERMTVRDVVVDEARRVVPSLARAHDEELASRKAAHHTADLALIERLQRAGRGAVEALAVELLLESPEDVDSVRAEVLAAGAELLDTRERTLVARATPDVVERLGALAHVLEVGLHRPKQNLSLGAALDLGQAPLAVFHRQGTGTGFLAAVWELDTCVRRTHPDFRSVTWQAREGGTTCSAGAWAGHATAVAGVLAADRGGTNTAGLFAANLFDVDDNVSAAVVNMWRRQPQVVNASFTITPFDGVDIDEKVYRQGTFVFNGAGNDATDGANCYAYNALCVGGYNMTSTPGRFGDDTVTTAASYLNYQGREFPQVVGPYAVGQTASASGSGYGGWGGTSFSSPAVAGLGGLLLVNYPFALWQKPSLLRAVLMASAQAHPILDGGRRIPSATDAVDDRAGVGAPHGARAQAIMAGSSYRYKRATPADLGSQAQIPVTAGERVRVVLAWDQCPGYQPFASQLKVDLDLVVRAPSMLRNLTDAYSNTSFSDNWEVVEFVAARTGTAEVFVSASRFEACAAEGGLQRVPMSVAWTKEATSGGVLLDPGTLLSR